MPVELVAPIRFWKCPSCGTTDRTQRSDAHTQFHPCPALGNVAIPLIEVADPDENVKGAQVLVEREDYIGEWTGAGPIAAIRTERLDGSNDCTVLAPVAVMKIT